ncbi:hypothetical protein BDP27DRAFT_729786 [Rhodocollybia butyracea]|uniref:Uncharacterized protein n=1 Tax=Rhodocollybia butyracea TaxID=206335 RepID=A0A9P5PTX6_9AGAR|nr:hypothetical protein BDP27DRAFT_729786 [Rhodocollybia butyracea]
MFYHTSRFPRERRMEWKKKHPAAHYLVMKPWSAEELISGLQLQDISRMETNAEALVKFRDQYGGSARDAYKYASNMSWCQVAISNATRGINEVVITEAFKSTPSSLQLPDDAGHMLLSVLPLSDNDRREFIINTPTEYLRSTLLDLIDLNREVASRTLYTICLGCPTPGSRALAAQIFDRNHSPFIRMGGTWELHQMKAPKPPR